MLFNTNIFIKELQHGENDMSYSSQTGVCSKTTGTLWDMTIAVIRSRRSIRQTFRTLSLILKYGY
jgi:hypothetical protein